MFPWYHKSLTVWALNDSKFLKVDQQSSGSDIDPLYITTAHVADDKHTAFAAVVRGAHTIVAY